MEEQVGLTYEHTEQFCEAFPADEVEFLSRSKDSGNTVGMPYIEARSVMARLDKVVGPAGWKFEWECLPGKGGALDGTVIRGRITVLGIVREDVGEAAAEGEKWKACVSDALKRTAVHFGIGRYLYFLPTCFGKYDGTKRRWEAAPVLKPADIAEAVRRAKGNPPTGSIKPHQDAPEPRQSAPAANGGQSAPAPPVSDPKPKAATSRSQEVAMAHAKDMGWDLDTTKNQIAAVLGRRPSKDAPTTEAEWRSLSVAFAEIAGDSRRAFKLWKALCDKKGWESGDRDSRLTWWSDYLQVELMTSSKSLIGPQWKKLCASIQHDIDPFENE